jgi:hypothetical protein
MYKRRNRAKRRRRKMKSGRYLVQEKRTPDIEENKGRK